MANMNVNVKEMGKQRGYLMGVGYRLIGWCKFVLLQKIFLEKTVLSINTNCFFVSCVCAA